MAVDVSMERWLLPVLLAVAHWVWGAPSVDLVIVVCLYLWEVRKQPTPNKFLTEIQDQSNLIKKLCYDKHKMADELFTLEGMIRERRHMTPSTKQAAKNALVNSKSL